MKPKVQVAIGVHQQQSVEQEAVEVYAFLDIVEIAAQLLQECPVFLRLVAFLRTVIKVALEIPFKVSNIPSPRSAEASYQGIFR